MKELSKEEIKEKIYQMYLDGRSTDWIAKQFGLGDRRYVYHRLGKLTPADKAEHARNQALRREQKL